jgi:hypothetical protein
VDRIDYKYIFDLEAVCVQQINIRREKLTISANRQNHLVSFFKKRADLLFTPKLFTRNVRRVPKKQKPMSNFTNLNLRVGNHSHFLEITVTRLCIR